MRFTTALVVLVIGTVSLWAQAPVKPPETKPPAKAPETDKKKPATSAEAEAKPITLTVVTKTGSQNKFARANGIKIYVLINGDEKHKTQLTNRRKNIFEIGATDTFKNIPVTVPLDKIDSIRLAAEGDDMWKCETISFQFFQKGLESREYKFSPARYLSTGKERKAFTPAAFLDFKLAKKPVLAAPEPDPKDKPKASPDAKKTGK